MFPNVFRQSVYQRIEYLHVTTELFIVVLAFKHKHIVLDATAQQCLSVKRRVNRIWV